MRILGFIALSFSEKGRFWERDLGLSIMKLRELGHDAHLVAFKHVSDLPADESPVMVATKTELENPAWWKNQAPDAIILNAWSAPRWHKIRVAATSLGVPTIEKLDTDGVKSSHIWLRNHFDQNRKRYSFDDSPWVKAKKVIRGMALVFAVWKFPRLVDLPMIRTMSLVPVYAAETPLASERVRRFLRKYEASPMPRVVTIPHPANSKYMSYDGQEKGNNLIAVGRWRAANKGWPLAFATAKKVLTLRPDWKFVIVGELPLLSASDEAEIASFQGRFIFCGMRSQEQVADLYRSAKIYLFPSVWETFNIAAVEALCCGCSVVGPTQLASSSYFSSFRSGTASHVRSPDHMADAVMTEICEWDSGQRDPMAISKTALEIFSVDTVAEKFVHIFTNWHEYAGKTSAPTE